MWLVPIKGMWEDGIVSFLTRSFQEADRPEVQDSEDDGIKQWKEPEFPELIRDTHIGHLQM